MDEAIEQRLGHLNGTSKLERPWVIQNGKLHKDFVFADFVEAFAFMTRVADIAEELELEIITPSGVTCTREFLLI